MTGNRRRRRMEALSVAIPEVLMHIAAFFAAYLISLKCS